MEVLKTSDALESQILEDARGKARRILEAADRECARIRTEWDGKDRQEAERLDANRDAKIAAVRQELSSSLPLDFMRTRLGFIQESIMKALTELFDALPAADLEKVLGRVLARASFAFTGAPVVVFTAGMTPEAARRLVQAAMPGAAVAEVKPLTGDDAADKGVVLQSADGNRRFRCTLRELTSLLLEEYREELMTALLGKDI
jgi:vacuolar-type H+-ATPase subunit E/Vma4